MKALLWISLVVIGTACALRADSTAVSIVGEPLELTGPGAYYMAPRWSPRGGTLAVTGPQYTGIYLVEFPDGDVVQLSDDPAVGFGMMWSHDGREIAVRIARYENRRRVYAIAVIDAETSEQRVVTDFVPSLPGIPQWTRDDQYIYMTGMSEFLLTKSGRTLQRGTSIAPGERIVFVQADRIYARETGSQIEVVIRQASGRILNLTISPDGEKIAYEVIGGAIWVSDTDGRNPVCLGIGDTPSWNPAGDKLVFAVANDDGHQILSSDLFVVNADGTGRVNLTATPDVLEMHPSWSPDGRWIAYGTLDGGRILVQEVR